MAYDRQTQTYDPSLKAVPKWDYGYVRFGVDEAGNDVGYPLRSHMATSAAPRTGKGAALIIPNLIGTQDNVLVIDPKEGENLKEVWRIREAMGKKVCALDPFRAADVPDRLRAKYNPLSSLDPKSRRIKEDIEAIADGLVITVDQKAAHWDGGARAIIAGIIADIITEAPADQRNLATLRFVLTKPQAEWDEYVNNMAKNEACGGLARSAAARIRRSVTETGHFLSAADENTKWLDSIPMQELLSESTFELSELKTGQTDVFLVLRSDDLVQHRRFLRLFVRCAIKEMAGNKGGKCLFVLDEFFALGRMEEIQTAAGLMPGYGVHLWIILQSLSQLEVLYDKAGAQTIMDCCEIKVFFGCGQGDAEYVSKALGNITFNELSLMAPQKEGVHAFPIPATPPRMPLMPDSYADRDLLVAANSQPAAPRMLSPPPLQPGKNIPAFHGWGTELLNVMNHGAYAGELAAQGRARAMIEELEKQRQTDYARARTRYEQELADQRHSYEMAKANYEYNLKEADRRYENQKAEIAHAFHNLGRSRLPADEVVVRTRKPLGEPVARGGIVFLPEGAGWFKPVGYFENPEFYDMILSLRKREIRQVLDEVGYVEPRMPEVPWGAKLESTAWWIGFEKQSKAYNSEVKRVVKLITVAADKLQLEGAERDRFIHQCTPEVVSIGDRVDETTIKCKSRKGSTIRLKRPANVKPWVRPKVVFAESRSATLKLMVQAVKEFPAPALPDVPWDKINSPDHYRKLSQDIEAFNVAVQARIRAAENLAKENGFSEAEREEFVYQATPPTVYLKDRGIGSYPGFRDRDTYELFFSVWSPPRTVTEQEVALIEARPPPKKIGRVKSLIMMFRR